MGICILYLENEPRARSSELWAPPSDLRPPLTSADLRWPPLTPADPRRPPLTAADLRPLTSDLQPPTSDLQPPTSDLWPPTSDLWPPTSDLWPPTSDLRPPTSDLRPLTSNLRPLTSDLWPLTSDLWPLTSDLWPPTSDLQPPTSDLLSKSNPPPSQGVNIVREHPYYSRLPNCKVEEKIKEFEDRLTNQKYAGLHTSMTKSRGESKYTLSVSGQNKSCAKCSLLNSLNT